MGELGQRPTEKGGGVHVSIPLDAKYKHRAAGLWRRRVVCVGMRKGRRLLVVGVALVAALRVALPVLARCPAGCWLVGYQ